ncbi:DUF1697 domain-containing protein [Saccharibacillus alkalitolerans]|uniref:DUF1697 domain-containing protein n=1 Tax=Saccharibacillus alkalitolerans TaxID=2705290 RepID=A0ABX0F7X8_9BACL|nr:DUF1697 domain-containing protein [Saccharibacillus alkalitolerans]NGZ77056.1 DUF1697 domain-containing protein [Saccharibacillus alkalitolerans]
MIYVALLRGVNVGGSNKIDMKTLKTAFESSGMKSVKTYINSGNIVFVNEERTRSELPAILEEAIETEFGLRIRVLVRGLEEMEAIAAVLPDHWSNGEEMKSDVFFLWDEVDETSVPGLLPLTPGIGTLLTAPRAVLYAVSRADAGRSGMNKLVGSKLYAQMTVRNVNTTRKILHMMKELAAGRSGEA